MRKKLLSILLALVVLGTVSGTVRAEDVYVTKYGKYYHKEGSRFIKNKEVEKLTREEAEKKGYKPGSEFSKEETKTSEKSK